VVFLAASLALAGCSAPKSYVVLMENADGTTGKIAVSGAKTTTPDGEKGGATPSQYGRGNGKADQRSPGQRT